MNNAMIDPEQLVPVKCPDCYDGRAVQHPKATEPVVCGSCSGSKYVLFPAVLLVQRPVFAPRAL